MYLKTPMRLQPGKTYKIKWQDVISFSEWKEAEELKAQKPVLIEAVYIYVGRGKAGLIFAGEKSDPDFGNATIIPPQLIKSIKRA